MTENGDFDSYAYSGYGIGSNVSRTFSLLDGSGFGKNVIMFGIDKSSSHHADNRKKDILIFGKDPVDGLDDTAITREGGYSLNFSEKQKNLRKSTWKWKQQLFICPWSKNLSV